MLVLQKDSRRKERAWGDEKFVNLLFLQRAGKAALPRETGVTKPCMERPKIFFLNNSISELIKILLGLIVLPALG